MMSAFADKARYILDLQDNWDGEGSPKYDEVIWQRAIDFADRTFTGVLPRPKIDPGPDGSIDIYWSHPRFSLLINVKATPTPQSDYYGNRRGGGSIKGDLNIAAPNQWLVMWITESAML